MPVLLINQPACLAACTNTTRKICIYTYAYIDVYLYNTTLTTNSYESHAFKGLTCRHKRQSHRQTQIIFSCTETDKDYTYTCVHISVHMYS